jgi:hypothetical protein
MPNAEIVLPRRAVSGRPSIFSPAMNKMLARM